MNLRQIEIFHAVYLNGSVSAAARALGISQPSVTKTLRHAEDKLGFPLFDRRHGRLVPTEDARVMFGEVTEIQARVAALKQTGRNIRRGHGGTLRISALPSLGLGLLPAAVARYLEDHPATAFDLDTVHHGDVARVLFDQSTDLVIAFQAPTGLPLATRWLGEGELGLLRRTTGADPSGQAERIALSSLDGEKIVSVVHSGPIGDLIAREMARFDIGFDDAVSARTFYVAAALVRAGVRSALIDNFTATAIGSTDLAFTPLKPAMTFDVVAIWLESRPPTVRMAAFLDIVAKLIHAI